MLWNIFFPGWHFLAFYGLQQKKNYCRQPWWRPLVNTSLISQFRENVISFNFLAKALIHLKNWINLLLKCSIDRIESISCSYKYAIFISQLFSNILKNYEFEKNCVICGAYGCIPKYKTSNITYPFCVFGISRLLESDSLRLLKWLCMAYQKQAKR